MGPPPGPMPRWRNRTSPWLWGLIALFAIATAQALRISLMPVPEIGPAAPAVPGATYTHAMVISTNFTGADLRGARLAHLDLNDKDFQGADAAGAVFLISSLVGASLSHANLRGADLRDTCLRGSDLTGADLAGADFTGADVTGVAVTSSALSETIGWGSPSSSSACS
jgi:Pentapeptide repeats (8 copies)